MLIRSQDKKSFINMNTVSQLYVDADNNITVDFNNSDDDGFEIIGEYSTEAKAIKVLDAIQTAYELSLYCDHAYDSSAQIQRPYIFVNNTVFQMPQDEEVEV